jgi:fucose permease
MTTGRTRVLSIGIAYAGFVVLGLPSGLLGVAWPSIRETFGIPLDAVGALMLATTAGYLLSSFSSGPVVSRVGMGRLLLASGAIAGVGLLGYAVAPGWWAMVLFGLLAGTGGGAIDAGLNTYFATNHSASLMNWLHACFGLGATLGPAVMTAVLNAGQSWRWGYAVAGALQGLFAICVGLTLRQWRLAGPQSPGAQPGPPARSARGGDTLRLPLVWFNLALFFMYTGTEGTAGQWPYSLLTEVRSVAPSTAGLWVSVYWGSLTVGRIVFGIVADRLGVVSSVRMCTLGVALGSAFIWWNATDALSFLGLALVGFALAPVFPLLVSVTPQRVGAEHAANAIGFQVAAAGLGISLLPGLAGFLAEKTSLEVIGPFMFAISIVMLLLHEAIVSRTR